MKGAMNHIFALVKRITLSVASPTLMIFVNSFVPTTSITSTKWAHSVSKQARIYLLAKNAS